jgi:hypothetical protein
MRRMKEDRWRVYDEDKRRLEEKDRRGKVVGCRDGRRRCFLPLVQVREAITATSAEHDRGDGNLFPFLVETCFVLFIRLRFVC